MKKRLMIGILLCCLAGTQIVHAEGRMTTITIDAEDETSEKLQYSLDDMENFSDENTFEVESGTTHTVYVRDEAGNITEQIVNVPEDNEGVSVSSQEDPEDNEDTDYSTAQDSGYVPPEEGGGTVFENTVTMGNSSDDAKQFLTVTTKNGHTFYIVVDNTSSSGNVYLLDQVTDEDLLSLIAEEDSQKAEEIAENRALETDETEETEMSDGNESKMKKEGKSTGMAGKLLIIVLVGALAGVYMYFKKKKGQKYDEDELKEEEDAADLRESFEPVDDEDLMDDDVFGGSEEEEYDADDEPEDEEPDEEEVEEIFADEYDDEDDGVE